MDTLPADVISSFEVLQGKIAAGPIPAGYPLAIALLADPVVVPVDEVEESEEEVVAEDPIDILLRQIASETVALPISFATEAPQRGARIALTLTKGGAGGESFVLVEECWIEKSQGRQAVVRLDPQEALFLQSARAFGAFGFIEIPADGLSPYQGRGVRTVQELKQLIEGDVEPQTAQANAGQPKRSRMKGYAWVTGEGLRYGLDEDGSISVVGSGDSGGY